MLDLLGSGFETSLRLPVTATATCARDIAVLARLLVREDTRAHDQSQSA